jgi:hypothetical protein
MTLMKMSYVLKQSAKRHYPAPNDGIVDTTSHFEVSWYYDDGGGGGGHKTQSPGRHGAEILCGDA